jgi:magnesium chelatase family protein
MPISFAITHGRSQCGLSGKRVVIDTLVETKKADALRIEGLHPAMHSHLIEVLRPAIENSGFTFPQGDVLIVVHNEHPCRYDCFDVTIAIGLLVASKQIAVNQDKLDEYEFFGQISADGTVSSVENLLCGVVMATHEKRCCLVPAIGCEQFAVVDNACIIPVKTLTEACEYLTGQAAREPVFIRARPLPAPTRQFLELAAPDHAKEAVIIAAAGKLGLLLLGPESPERLEIACSVRRLLEPLSASLALEVALRSAAGGEPLHLGHWDEWGHRPALIVDEDITDPIELLGPAPADHEEPHLGKIVMAHCGLLVFSTQLGVHPLLEDLQRWQQRMRERLPEGAPPVEELSQFQVVVTASNCADICNPNRHEHCMCKPEDFAAHEAALTKLALPFCDVCVLLLNSTTQAPPSCGLLKESDEAIVQRVAAAQARQRQRQGVLNGELSPIGALKNSKLNPAAEQLFVDRFGSDPATEQFAPLLRVALTIADLEGSKWVDETHVGAALAFARPPDLAQTVW